MLEGYVFVSETDTEVLAHLLADVRKKRPALSPAGAVRAALRLVTGAFGVAVVFADQPDLLIGARHGSPLLLGVGCGEYFLASDASAIVEHTSVVEYLAERELVVITRAGYTITSLDAADEDYAKAADLARTSPGARSNLVVLQTLFGRAAVAECRGDLDSSRKYLAEAETLAGTDWEPIAKLAKTRIDGLVALATPVALPRNADLPAPPAAAPATPAATGDDLFQNILQEQQKQDPATGGTPAPGGM
jgi:hypothetical protein